MSDVISPRPRPDSLPTSSKATLPHWVGDLLAVLRTPALVGCLAGALAFSLSLLSPNTYASELTILADAGKRPASRSAGLWAPTSEGDGPMTRPEDGPTVAYTEIIQSRWVVDKLLKETYEYTVPGSFLRKERSYQRTLLDHFQASTLDEGASRLKRIMTISRDLKSGMMRVRVETTSPSLSQQVVNQSAAFLEDYLSDLTRRLGDHKRSFAERQLMEAEEKYKAIERDVIGYLSGNRSLNLQELNAPGGFRPGVDPVVQVRVEKLRGDLERQRQVVTALSLQLQQGRLEAQNDIPTLMMLDQGNLPTVKSGPRRTFGALVAAVAAFLITLAVTQRAWLTRHLLTKEPA